MQALFKEFRLTGMADVYEDLLQRATEQCWDYPTDLPFLHIEASKYHDLFSRKITFEND